jgi:putative phosphoesterase
MLTIGVLSDTHLVGPDRWFRQKAAFCFAEADMVLHAGDLTSLSVLEVFTGKTVHAVYGNMCGLEARETLPASKIIQVGNFRLALVHGVGFRHNIEDRLFDIFAPIDCIVYGHTHIPVCHRYGPTLMLNPGSFTAAGTYGASGTYGIITVDRQSMEGRIHPVREAS